MNLFWILTILFLVRSGANHCPVLHSHGELSSLFHGYPVNMLLPSVLADHPHSKFRNCTSRNLLKEPDAVELCSADTSLCAVTKQNVQTTMSAADWPQYAEALRRLQTAIKEGTAHTMNIFVLGGSMTRGANTFSACICRNTSESSCPAAEEKINMNDCSWSTMLSRWLGKDIANNKITIDVHNLAQSGVKSREMANNVGDLLRRHTYTTTISANDLVFVDHSVNDLWSGVGVRGVRQKELQLGFESLIRRLLHLTETGERPTIIVLEQHPFATRKKKLIPGLQGIDDYAVTYREISKHYGLLLWSLREVTWTYLNLTTAGALNSSAPVDRQVLVDGVQHVHMYPKPADNDLHPPWWRHLFMADVLADCMLRVMALVSSSTPRSLYTHAPFSSQPYVIPAPIRNISALTQGLCDTSQPFVVDAHPVSSFTPADVGAFETDTATVSKLGWREYTDYHDTPGWIINSLSDPAQNHLTFPLAERDFYHRLVIKILYLKSYSGMGMVGVKLCGAFVKRDIDALYHDYETFRFSLPTESFIKIRKVDSGKCVDAAPENRTLQIVYYGAQQDEFLSVRQQHNHKFKLLSVEVCSPVDSEKI